MCLRRRRESRFHDFLLDGDTRAGSMWAYRFGRCLRRVFFQKEPMTRGSSAGAAAFTGSTTQKSHQPIAYIFGFGAETVALPKRLRELKIDQVRLERKFKKAQRKRISSRSRRIRSSSCFCSTRRRARTRLSIKKRSAATLSQRFTSTIKLLIVYYNIREDKPKLARPDLAWFESANKEKFDQRLVWWRCCIAG